MLMNCILLCNGIVVLMNITGRQSAVTKYVMVCVRTGLSHAEAADRLVNWFT